MTTVTASNLTAGKLTASIVGILHSHSNLSAFTPNRFSPATVSYRSRHRLLTTTALYKSDYIVKEEGTKETLDYRVFFADSAGKKVSPWHDIPLSLGDGVFNFVVEIPKNSSAKMEVATDEAFTPIKQDTKKGKLRYYP